MLQLEAKDFGGNSRVLCDNIGEMMHVIDSIYHDRDHSKPFIVFIDLAFLKVYHCFLSSNISNVQCLYHSSTNCQRYDIPFKLQKHVYSD